MAPTRRQWPAPAGLIALSLVPVAAGGARLSMLASGAEATAESMRFVSTPAPVVIHIVGATVYCLLGALQFVPSLRAGSRRWHRFSGRLLVPFGLAAALSGMWMAVWYDLPASDNALLEAERLVVGAAMAAALVLGVVTILRRNVDGHQAWMTRAYALGLGAGTQVVLILPWTLAFGQPAAGPRAVLMGAAWAINLAVAEFVIRRRRGASAATGSHRSATAPLHASVR